MAWNVDWTRHVDRRVRVLLVGCEEVEGHCIDISADADFPAMRILFDKDITPPADSGTTGRDFWIHPRHVWPIQ